MSRTQLLYEGVVDAEIAACRSVAILADAETTAKSVVIVVVDVVVADEAVLFFVAFCANAGAAADMDKASATPASRAAARDPRCRG
jgi:hypothetical protein